MDELKMVPVNLFLPRFDASNHFKEKKQREGKGSKVQS